MTDTSGTPHVTPSESTTPLGTALELLALPGSERPAVQDAAGSSPAGRHARSAPAAKADGGASSAPAGPIEVTVVLRRRDALPPATLPGAGIARAQLAQRYGADPADVDAAVARFTGLGLDVVTVDAASRRLRLRGDAATFERVFGTSLSTSGPSDATARTRTGGLFVPADLDGIVTAVLGLDNRPQSRPMFRVAETSAVSVSYTPVELAKVYDFPAGVDGSGQTVAVIELGGGYEESDLSTYFRGLGLTPPSVTAVGVDGAQNQPGQDPSGADGEVMLDIEVVGAMAPGADIVVYFAPNTDDGFLDAVSQAAHATPTPAAISISWGQAENEWTAQARTAMDDAFADAAALGVTVTCAAGDDGSTDRESDGKSHVDFPAASPNALACGGTRLQADAATGAVSAETVWNNGSGNGATGGGYSVTFARPDYQKGVLTSGAAGRTGAAVAAGTGRGVPDVAAVADPRTGYEILVDGERTVIGGTSAVAPLWAALVARLAQQAGHGYGLIQPLLYAAAAPDALRDITEGNNGAYSAGPGWDACTGLGVPIGTAIAALTPPSSGG